MLFVLHAFSLPVVLLGPSVFRSQAVLAEIPKYPHESLSMGHQGTAAVDLSVSEVGKVITVDVLEAPDEAIRKELSGTLFKWRFKITRVAESGAAVATKGRLLFLFRKDKNGNPEVIDLVAQGSH